MLIGDPQNEKRIRGIGSLTHIMSDLFSLVVTIKGREFLLLLLSRFSRV